MCWHVIDSNIIYTDILIDIISVQMVVFWLVSIYSQLSLIKSLILSLSVQKASGKLQLKKKLRKITI